MKIKTIAAQLRDILKAACEVAPAKGIIPKHSCLYLRAEDCVLCVFAMNDTAEISLTHPCDVLEEGEALVPARTLLDYISLSSGEVTIETKGGNSLTVTSAKKKNVIACMDASTFAEMKFDGEEVFTAGGSDLCAALNRTSFAASTDESRESVCGVRMNVDPDGAIHFAAINECTFSLCDMTALGMKKAIQETMGVTIPNPSVRLITSLFSSCGAVTVSMEPTRIMLSAEGKALAFPVVVRPFANYQAIIPTQYAVEALVNAKDLMDALKTVNIAASSDAGNNRRFLISLTVKDGSIISVSTRNASGASDVDVDCQANGEDITVYFNVVHMLNVVTACAKECGEIVLQFASPVRPVCVKPLESSAAMRTYIAPVRQQPVS